MQNKDLIIIASIVVIIYLYYQQQQEYNQSPHIIESPNTQQLRSELNHYQSLYQKRVEKDLDSETLNSEWETRYNQLESLNNQTNREKNELVKYQALLEKKIDDLENQLLNLAKQKIKGKKEAQRLLNELETQRKQDKENWQQEKQKLVAKTSTLTTSTQTNLTKLGMTGLTLHWEQYNEWAKELGIDTKNKFGGWSLEEVQAKYKEKLAQEFATKTQPLITDLKTQITQKDEEIKNVQESNAQLNNSKSILVNRLGKKEEELVKFREQVNQLEQQQQEKLRKINVLFDENANNYETIDFEGLYSLLEKTRNNQQFTQQVLNQIDNYLENNF